jgi:hypothetical protein
MSRRDPALRVWRHVLVHEEKFYPVAPDAQVSMLPLTDGPRAISRAESFLHCKYSK